MYVFNLAAFFSPGHPYIESTTVLSDITSSPPVTECRAFLLYCLPNALLGVLPDKYFARALLLSKAIRILVGDSVSLLAFDIAEELLHLFWKLTENYYGMYYYK